MKTRIRIAIFALVLLASTTAYTQTCDCEKEFLYIQNIIEKNYAGFGDKLITLSKELYLKRTNELRQLTRGKFNTIDCIYIIRYYLDQFKDSHIQFGLTQDTAIRNRFPMRHATFSLYKIKIQALQKSTGWEGIYYSRYDSSFKI